MEPESAKRRREQLFLGDLEEFTFAFGENDDVRDDGSRGSPLEEVDAADGHPSGAGEGVAAGWENACGGSSGVRSAPGGRRGAEPGERASEQAQLAARARAIARSGSAAHTPLLLTEVVALTQKTRYAGRRLFTLARDTPSLGAAVAQYQEAFRSGERALHVEQAERRQVQWAAAAHKRRREEH